MTDKLHCVRCGVEMSNFMDGAKGYQPNDGLAFKTHGHYGSTYFDPMDSSYLEIAVCDKCIKECEEDGLVFRFETDALKHENSFDNDDDYYKPDESGYSRADEEWFFDMDGKP